MLMAHAPPPKNLEETGTACHSKDKKNINTSFLKTTEHSNTATRQNNILKELGVEVTKILVLYHSNREAS